MNITETKRRWTNEQARLLHAQLLEAIKGHNTAIQPKVEALLARGRNDKAAKLLDDHRWVMQPLINQAARLVSDFTVPFMIVANEDDRMPT